MKRQRNNEGTTESFDLTNCLMLLSCPKQSRIESVGFECKTCNRKFSSFQALGGHRASHHKRVKLNGEQELKEEAKSLSLWNKPKMHVCSVCGLGFSLGQALGGHMRKHRISTTTNEEGFSNFSSIEHVIAAKVPVLNRSNSKRIMCLDLDLNFTPMENDLMMFGKIAPIPVPLSLF